MEQKWHVLFPVLSALSWGVPFVAEPDWDDDEVTALGVPIIRLSNTLKEGEEGDIRLFEPPALISTLAEIVGERRDGGEE